MSLKDAISGLAGADFAIPPIERAETIPANWYLDESFYALDQEILFERAWHFVGHTTQLPQPGSYLVTTIGGESIIIVRDTGGEVRAFYNVCRHRGGPLVLDACGGVEKVLQCKYHGWTYKLDGSLRGVPRFDRVDLFDKKDYGLVPVDIERWEGLLFVRLSEKAGRLEDRLEGIRERIRPIQLHTMQFYRQVVYEIACNWKVYVDNYLEGYHLPFVHPELCDILDIKKYTTETSAYYSLQHSPITEEENVYGASGGTAYYYHIFPNFMLNILPGRLQTNVILPAGREKTLVIFDYYFSEVDSAAAIRHIEEDIAFSDKVQEEDVLICEHVQQGLRSKAYDRGRFSVECEEGVYHFQALLKRAYHEVYSELHAHG